MSTGFVLNAILQTATIRDYWLVIRRERKIGTSHGRPDHVAALRYRIAAVDQAQRVVALHETLFWLTSEREAKEQSCGCCCEDWSLSAAGDAVPTLHYTTYMYTCRAWRHGRGRFVY